ncbi:unnamed protein product, partial [Gulo gulo]
GAPGCGSPGSRSRLPRRAAPRRARPWRWRSRSPGSPAESAGKEGPSPGEDLPSRGAAPWAAAAAEAAGPTTWCTDAAPETSINNEPVNDLSQEKLCWDK